MFAQIKEKRYDKVTNKRKFAFKTIKFKEKSGKNKGNDRGIYEF